METNPDMYMSGVDDYSFFWEIIDTAFEALFLAGQGKEAQGDNKQSRKSDQELSKRMTVQIVCIWGGGYYCTR